MSNFPDCAGPILEKMADSPYAKWGSFTDPAAKIIVKVSQVLRCPPEAVAVTWLNETTFTLRPKPNLNGRPDDVTHHDMGPLATNVYWLRKAVEKKLIPPFDEMQVFGTLAPNNDNFFDGGPYINVMVGMQFLLAWHGSIEDQVVAYTGKDHQSYRRQSWREWSPLFRDFFSCYKPDSV